MAPTDFDGEFDVKAEDVKVAPGLNEDCDVEVRLKRSDEDAAADFVAV